MGKPGKIQTKGAAVTADPGDASGAISTAASSRVAGDIVTQVQTQQQTASESRQPVSTQIKTLTPLWQLNVNTAKLAE